jgi:hypothetical protein
MEKKGGDEKIPLFNRLTLECRDVAKFITHSVDAPLSLRQRLLMKWHLMLCDYCRRFQRQIVWIHKVLRQKADTEYGEETEGLYLSDEAKERIKRALKQDSD